jgi:hypothetical protein
MIPAYDPSVLQRTFLLAVAAAAIAFAVTRHHDADRCAGARGHAFSIGQGHAGPERSDAVVRDLMKYCRGASDIASGAGSLQGIGRLDAAARLARAAVAREPANEDGWLALALVERRLGNQRATDRAVARLHRIDPQYRFPAG